MNTGRPENQQRQSQPYAAQGYSGYPQQPAYQAPQNSGWFPQNTGSYTSGQMGGPAGYPQSGATGEYASYPVQGQNYTGVGQSSAFAQGAAYARNGYSQQGGYPYPQQGGIPQAGAPYPPNGNNPYTAGSYPLQGGPAGYPQQNSGSYIPQTPYSQGYTAQGAGYGQPYNPYPSAGRTPQNPNQGQNMMPLNGGGYVPPPVQLPKKPFVFDDVKLILLSAVLLALFIIGLAAHIKAMMWAFLILAAASVVLLWVKPKLTAKNKRLCFTAVFGALAVVAIVYALGIGPVRGNGTPDATNSPRTSSVGGNTVVDPLTNESISTMQGSRPQSPTPSPSPAPEDNEAETRLMSFFYYWAQNMDDKMLELCAPSWARSQDNAKYALFSMKQNRVPREYRFIGITGTQDDTSRTATVDCLMDRNNPNKVPTLFRLDVLMLREDGQWYVDPKSLHSNIIEETPDPADVETATPSPTPPTAPNTILYYNPDKGTKYHLDQNCPSTNAKYLPFKGRFTFAEVNDEKYKKLTPCNRCNAPLRP